MINRASLLSLIVLLGFSIQAWSAVPGKAQAQCLLALQQVGGKVAEVANNDALNCVRNAGKGKLAGAAITTCLVSESQALKKARAKTNEVIAKKCGSMADFGPGSAQEINAAYTAMPNLSKIFGSDIAATLKTSAGNSQAAACQTSLAEEMVALGKLEIADYGRCSKQLLKANRAASAAELESCLGQNTAAMQKAKARATARLAGKCATVSGTIDFPGACAGVAADELGNCLAAQAHCNTIQAVNGAERLKVSGHQFKDGVATYYCGSKPKPSHSVARLWNDQILDAIRIDNPRPPVHARNLFHLSVAMYDAWAAYDASASQYLTAEYPQATSLNPKREREIAISFAAYRVLVDRYSKKHSLGYATSLPKFAAQMDALGCDKNFTQTSGDSPAALGNRIAASILAHGASDGSNEAEDYADASYQPVNKPLIVKEIGIDLLDPETDPAKHDPNYRLDPNRWQPLALDKIISQNGIPLPGKIQTSIGSQWGTVTPFAMSKAAPEDLYLDPGPQPALGGEDDALFKTQILDVIRLSSQLTPDDATLVDISPASQGNNTLGSNDGEGYTVNPITGQHYATNLVKRGDFGRVLAEWWADGPTSETPPGHWNVIANSVSDSSGFERRISGGGLLLSPLEWDVKLYFALNGATHDAAIAAWGAKRKYDGVRPITMVRYMGTMGQSSNPLLPSYHANGLPLEDGLVEVITAQSAAPGQRHAHLVTNDAGGHVGDIAIYVWPGSPANTKTQYSGVKWVLAKAWVPYQRETFVTPAFPGYISGHSTFSRSAAEVMASMTGSQYFPGGLYEYTAKKNAYLIHELGPSDNVKLQWASYFDASDQSGRSRLWGGIHVEADDFAGRTVGHQAGLDAFNKAISYFNGTAQP